MGLGLGRDAHGLADTLRHAFDIEEVDLASSSGPMVAMRRSGPDARDRPLFAGGARKACADFKQADITLLAAKVMSDGVHQTRKGRGPKYREVLRERVGDRNEIVCAGERCGRG